MQNTSLIHPTAEGISHYEGLKKYSGFGGKILHFFGVAVKIHDSRTDKDVFIKISDISRDLIGKTSSINAKEKKLVDLRILEIAWSRWMALRYSKKISQCITTQLDVLRTSPQEAVNYMIKHKDQYQPIGLLTRPTRP